jgi:hypothetical protein
MKTKLTLAALLLFAAASVFAQKGDYTKDPGYIDLNWLSSYTSGDKGTEMIVEQGMLKMLGKMAAEKSDELAKQFGELKLVRLNSFGVSDDNIKAIEEKINAIDKELIGKDWDRLVHTKSGKDYANIYVKTSGSDRFLGIVAISLNYTHKMASFVNVVGNIDPALIGKLAKGMNIPQLGKLRKDADSK